MRQGPEDFTLRDHVGRRDVKAVVLNRLDAVVL